MQRKALVLYYDMHCQQRNVNTMMLVWRWRAQQRQECAVARAEAKAIKDARATEAMVHAKTTIRLRQQLREAEEQAPHHATLRLNTTHRKKSLHVNPHRLSVLCVGRCGA